MPIQFFKTEKLVKKTKPKSSLKVLENGFLDEETGETHTYVEFFSDFVDKYVTLNVSEASTEDLSDK